MVIPDWGVGPRPPKIELSYARTLAPEMLARPTDRLAAAIVDVFVLLTPIYILLSAPLKRWLTTSFILGAEPDFVVTLGAMGFLGGAIVVLYQTLMLYFFGTTVGKRLFDLEVVSMFEGETLSFWDFFIRSMTWVLEVFMLGLPWLAVFANNKRRPLHDRVSDSVVVTHASSGVRAPARWERSLVRSLFAGFVAVITLAMMIQIHRTVEQLRMEQAFASLMERDTGYCEVVSDAAGEETADHARLKTAMALYAAGLADRSCLESEVERESALQIPVAPVTYLAQAFVHADDAEVSNSYLDEVCEVDAGTVECAMSRLVTSWSDEDWERVEEILENAPRGSGYLEVWGVRHYMKQARYIKALSMLDTLTGRRELSQFSLMQRVKALYNAYSDDEARVAFQQAFVALPEPDALDLSAWLCAQELQSGPKNGCQAAEGVACRQLRQKDPGLEIHFDQPHLAMAQFLTLECKGRDAVDYLGFSETVRDEGWATFFRANLKRQREDKSASAALFAKVIASTSAPDLLKVESARRWIQFATPRQMERLVELWRDLESKEAWVKTGNLLFARLAEQNNSKLALIVARHLLTRESLSPRALETLTALVETRSMERKPAAQLMESKEQVKRLLDAFEEVN
ncbi:MAG: RDD family protein [Bdellovibrionales bacterium]